MRSAASRALGFFCALAFALTLATPALAAHFRKGETFVLPEGETLDDDLYALGATVAINGTVNGDLMVVARHVIIRGTVTGSVFAGGQEITVIGPVGRTLRAAGGHIDVKGPVHGDAVLAGGQIELWSGATVGRDLVAGGGHLVVADTVHDDALLLAEAVRLENTALIEQNLDYSSDKPLVMAPGARIKGNVRDRSGDWKTKQDPSRRMIGKFINWVRGLIGMFIFGLLLVLPFKGFFHRATDTIGRSVIASLGVGLLMLFLFPLAGMFLLLLGILAGGWWIAFFVFALFLFAIATGYVVSALGVGRWIGGLLGGRGLPIALVLLMGLLALALVKTIPILGWMIACAAMLLGFGALGLAVARRNRGFPAVAGAPPAL